MNWTVKVEQRERIGRLSKIRKSIIERSQGQRVILLGKKNECFQVARGRVNGTHRDGIKRGGSKRGGR